VFIEIVVLVEMSLGEGGEMQEYQSKPCQNNLVLGGRRERVGGKSNLR
jgi:hypothetical protein